MNEQLSSSFENAGEYVLPDVEGMKAELCDPDTSLERIDEIMQIVRDAGMVAGSVEDVSRRWNRYTSEQLSDMLLDPRVSTADKDSIAAAVNSGRYPLKNE